MTKAPDNSATPQTGKKQNDADKPEGDKTNISSTAENIVKPAEIINKTDKSSENVVSVDTPAPTTTPAGAPATSSTQETIDPKAKHWKFPRTNDFYHDLAMRESHDVVNAQNRLGYIGLYQMDEAVLADTGYYKKKARPGHKQYNNDWTGTWTGKDGLTSKSDFMSNREVQVKIIRKYHKLIWDSYLKNYHQYDGQTINGHKFTKSGMIAASHLVGAGSVKELINSGGKKIRADANHVTAYDYLDEFAGYDIDFSDVT